MRKRLKKKLVKQKVKVVSEKVQEMAMKKVYCKKCGEGLLMAYDPDKIDPELEKSLKACEDTPCYCKRDWCACANVC